MSSAGPEILGFVSHCLANFQPILDCFIQNFKLKYEDLKNVKQIVEIQSFQTHIKPIVGRFIEDTK